MHIAASELILVTNEEAEIYISDLPSEFLPAVQAVKVVIINNVIRKSDRHEEVGKQVKFGKSKVLM